MAVDPHKSTDVVPHDGHGDHRHEKPSDWGWHGTFPRATQVAGWLTVIILVLMVTATHYNHSGTGWLLIFAAAIALGLILDIRARRNAWRR
ncbi:MAG TPA: DUF2631 domain-containing protein [Jatrophihabitantaceae bacterium]|nr:DUF2631 domain-containing protein [Jatrophihabitantaceae bacterium]